MSTSFKIGLGAGLGIGIGLYFLLVYLLPILGRMSWLVSL